jgi:hypothetical protein
MTTEMQLRAAKTTLNTLHLIVRETEFRYPLKSPGLIMPVVTFETKYFCDKIYIGEHDVCCMLESMAGA